MPWWMEDWAGWLGATLIAALLGFLLWMASAQSGQQVGENSAYAREQGKSKLLFYDSSNRVQYICEADAGTASSAAKWRIQKLAYVVSGNGAGQTESIFWANGSDEMNAVCDNRAALNYS